MNVSKTITATAGSNQVSINEAAQFARGIYVVEISDGSQVVSTQKIVKQ